MLGSDVRDLRSYIRALVALDDGRALRTLNYRTRFSVRAQFDGSLLMVEHTLQTSTLRRDRDVGHNPTSPRTGADRPQRMVTLVFLCRRRPDVTHARYAALLLDGHVPLALRHHPTLRRYVVNVVEESLADAPPLDSIGELSFDSLADYEERLYDSGEGRKVIARDVAGFMGGADAYVTTTARADVTAATPRLGERSPGVKLVVCVPPPAGVSREPFAERWARAVEGLAVRSQIAGSVERRLESGAVDYAGIGALHLEGESPPGLLDELRRALGTIAAYRVAEYVQRR